MDKSVLFYPLISASHNASSEVCSANSNKLSVTIINGCPAFIVTVLFFY